MKKKTHALLGFGEAESGARSGREDIILKREERLDLRMLWGWEEVLILKVRRIWEVLCPTLG